MGYSFERGITITNPFQKISKESNRKTKKTWVDKGREFYDRSIKSWLEKHIQQHDEEKSGAAARFNRR